ncbi:hypothetical protein J4230_05415 [Candidatus Woesearchaeota archaeon]|nr:hypothetical protein [Candidatus Woesearchaeota archaeon]
MDNLLDKIKAILKDSCIILVDQYRLQYKKPVGFLSGDEYINYRFNIAPKNGFDIIDSESISCLNKLLYKIFHDFTKPDYQMRYITLRDCSGMSSYGGIINKFELLPWDKRILCTGNLIAGEPVGIIEEQESYESRIFPRYEDEFNGTKLHKQRIESKHKSVLSRRIVVSLSPSFGYLNILTNVCNRQNELLGKMGNNDILHKEYEDLETKKYEIGFPQIGEVFIENYNKYFGKSKSF